MWSNLRTYLSLSLNGSPDAVATVGMRKAANAMSVVHNDTTSKLQAYPTDRASCNHAAGTRARSVGERCSHTPRIRGNWVAAPLHVHSATRSLTAGGTICSHSNTILDSDAVPVLG